MNNQTDQSSLHRMGSASWMMLGVIFLVATIYVILTSLSGLVTPLVIAAVVGILFVPLVERLARFMPRPLASSLVLVGLVVLGIVTVAITVAGIVDQAPQIQAQVTAGLNSLVEWLRTLGLNIGDPADIFGNFEELLAGVIPGLASFISGAFSSAASFAIGIFAAVFFLYFVLADWDEVSGWVGSHLGLPNDLGGGIIEDTVWSMRQYFYVLTVSSLVTAVLIGGTMAVLALPLAATVALVTFGSTIVGAVLAGILGATLSAPIVAMTISINRRIRAHRLSDGAIVGDA